MLEEVVEREGMEGKGEDFMMGWGKLEGVWYKDEMEGRLGRGEYGGFELVGLNE